MVRLPGFQGASSACRYQALIGPNQATGLAGGFDLFDDNAVFGAQGFKNRFDDGQKASKFFFAACVDNGQQTGLCFGCRIGICTRGHDDHLGLIVPQVCSFV